MATLSENSYFGKLVSAGLTELGDKKTPAMVLDFEITHQAMSGKWDPITEVRRGVTFFLTEKAREMAFADLRKIGFNGDMETPLFAAEMSEGTELTVEHEEYQGKIQERVRIAKLKPSNERKPAPKDLARLLAAQFKQFASSAARPTAPPPAPPAPLAQAARVGDDGVPF